MAGMFPNAKPVPGVIDNGDAGTRPVPRGPLVQSPFLMMIATLGGCPPSLWFPPMGFRTRFEIQAERDELLRRLRELPPG